MGASVQSISVADVSAREVDVRGVMRYCNVSYLYIHHLFLEFSSNLIPFRYCYLIQTYPTAIEMLASKKVDLKSLITDRYKFKDALEAFKHVKEAREGTIKVVIENDQ